MKLLRFSVNNYRGISGGVDKNSIDLGRSNAIFIFGQNNVGKSSFLKAYVAFYEDKVSPDDFTYDEEKDITAEIHLKIDEGTDKPIIDEGSGNKFDNLKSKYLDSDSVLKLRKTWRFSDKGKVTLNETCKAGSSEWVQVGYGGIGLHSAFQALMMKPLFIHAMPTEDQVEMIVNEVLKEAATKNLSNDENEELKQAIIKISALQDKVYSKHNIDTYKNKVNGKFTSLFSSYKIDIDDGTSKAKFTHDKIGKDFKISFRKLDNAQPSSYMQMGHGAVRMAIFLLMLMKDELGEHTSVSKNFLVLFEEPELFLHPSLTKKLRSLIYEVSTDNMPFQVLCVSHSPQMVDISKDHNSLVRMVKDNNTGATRLFQIKNDDLINNEQPTSQDVKQKIYELLRLDPFICESFYADEVVLVEGDTEAIIWRGYDQNFGTNEKDVFVVNCNSCNNIPFYQKIFSKFNISYSVICDTDHIHDGDPEGTNRTGWDNKTEEPNFTSGIQKTIKEQYLIDRRAGIAKHMLVFPKTFEPCHERMTDPFTYNPSGGNGKPFNANRYWEKIIVSKDQNGFNEIPIIKHIKRILS